MPKPKLLIVDDDECLRTQMKWSLSQDFEVLTAQDRVEALAIFETERPSIATLDLGLPPDEGGVAEGYRTLSAILQQDPLCKVIIITGRDEKEYALKAIDQGAYDFFCKPVQIDELRMVLRRALHVSDLERENLRLQQQLKVTSFEGILGTSPQMQEVFSVVRKVATTDVPVLILGESGTGKELLARAIHNLSARKKHPFVGINCGAIPENLLESELFGHEKGAFTGAHAQKQGRIETAEGGTLFLDEVGDLPSALQVKLLRFLQEQQVLRVGGRTEINVNVRIVAATNVDLKRALAEGRFREDLYYRLGVVTIKLPSLRSREGDIQLLAKVMLKRYAAEMNTKVTGFTNQALRIMEQHSWPGNVRELENRIKRAVVMADRPTITPKDLELESSHAPKGRTLKDAREALDRELIKQAMDKHKGNMSRAAVELGISRPTMYDLMEKLTINKN